MSTFSENPQSSFMLFVHSETFTHICLPQIVSLTFQWFSFQVPDQPKPLAATYEICADSFLWPFLFPSKMSNHKSISTHHCPTRTRLEWQEGCNCPLVVGAWLSGRITYQLDFFFLFFGQLALGNSLWGHRYRFEERRSYSRNREHGHLGHFVM